MDRTGQSADSAGCPGAAIYAVCMGEHSQLIAGCHGSPPCQRTGDVSVDAADANNVTLFQRLDLS